jgi:multisubunit Na+/H+ antiporter MnhG subunit
LKFEYIENRLNAFSALNILCCGETSVKSGEGDYSAVKSWTRNKCIVYNTCNFLLSRKDVSMKTLMYVSLGLTLVAALGYFLMGIGVIQPGSYDTNSAPTGIVWVACGCYVVGGALILLKRRNLWITGTVINAIVILFFYARYRSQSDIMLSAPGLITKIAQILLEAGLIYLIIKSKPKASPTTK